MFRVTRRVALLLLLAGVAAGLTPEARAEPDGPADDDIPLVGRPDFPFSGGSGNFTVEARAEPTTLRAEKPLTFTLLVRATGPVRHAPERLDLRQLPAFAGRFYILEEPADGTRHPAPDRWEFVYRLKPRRAEVGEVPGVPFVFFNPAIPSAAKGFQIRFTDPIPLRILPAEEYRPLPRLPDEAYQITTGSALLARRAAWQPLGPAAVWLLLGAPPLVCAAWYAGWRRLHPDAGAQVRRRRSRAARQALHRVRGLRRLPPDRRADGAAAAVTDYLRQRLELPPAEPTPAEAATHLGRAGCPEALAGQAADFFRACDAARFRPATATGPASDGLPGAAARLILAVEDAT
jgi:hypothetical protein